MAMRFLEETFGRRRLRELFVGLTASFLIVSAAVAQAAENKISFNSLVAVVVDSERRSATLLGTNDPAGPRDAVPYAEFLATALRLPKERDGGPAFDLELPNDFEARIGAIRKRLPSTAEINALLVEYFAKNPAAYEAYVESSLAQILPQARETLKRILLAKGLDRQAVNRRIDAIASLGQLKATVLELQRERLLRSNDPSLERLFPATIDEFQAMRGNLFFYPEGTIEAIQGVSIYLEPKFTDIDSNTQFARVMLEADVALKQISGSPKLKEALPFHRTLFEWQFKNHSATELLATAKGEILMAMRAVPKIVKLAVSTDNRIISFERAEMSVLYSPRDPRQPAAQTDISYGEFISSHYDDYAKELEPLWELRELIKIVAVARHLQAQGISIDLPADRSWVPPRRVESMTPRASVGTGSNYVNMSFFVGGVTVRVADRTQTGDMPAGVAERIRKVADSLSARQLSAVANTVEAGICFDGQRGCSPGQSIAAVRVGSPPPSGSAALSPATLEKMRRAPASKALLEDEERAKAALGTASSELLQKQLALTKAENPTEKGRLQVDLVKARQAETDARNKARVAEIKVQDAAKVIEEVELEESKPKPGPKP